MKFWSAKNAIVRGLATAAATVLAFGLLPSISATASVASPAVATDIVIAQILADTNEVRAQAGKAPLVQNTSMDAVAAAWSRQMFSKRELSHNPSYTTQIPSGWSRAAENVAYGQRYTDVVAAWAGSPGHLANMTGDYTDVGLGYYEQDGQRYFTQVFAKYPTTGQQQQQPSLLPASAATGSFDAATATYGGLAITGWAVSRTTRDSVPVKISVDGRLTTVTADKSLPWIDALYPSYGSNHGFETVVPVSTGSHRVCVTGVVSFGCRTVIMPEGAGSLDSVQVVPGGARVSGWSVGFQSSEAAYIWVNVDGQGGAYVANTSRPWINSYFAGIGENHGFDINLTMSPGRHEICVFGSTLLGCRTVDVGPADIGAFDTIESQNGSLRLTGWAIDFSNERSPYIWVDVNGSGKPYLADKPLSWFEAMFPGAGKNHGFDLTIPASSGPARVCVYARISLIGCKTVNNTKSAGAFDRIEGGVGTLTVSGWSVDLTRSTPSYIWVNVDGNGGAYVADERLAWFNALYPDVGLNHGYRITVPATPGPHQVCVYGTEQLLDCKTVVVSG